MLTAGRDLQIRLAVERRNLHHGTERRLREADRHATNEVVFVALEKPMRLYGYITVQIAARPTVLARFTFAANADRLTVSNPRWDLYGEHPTLGRTS